MKDKKGQIGYSKHRKLKREQRKLSSAIRRQAMSGWEGSRGGFRDSHMSFCGL